MMEVLPHHFIIIIILVTLILSPGASLGEVDKAGDSGSSSSSSSSFPVKEGTASPPVQPQHQHTLSTRKMLLFAKALHKIVESRCGQVDNSELDSFQAYLSRQIVSGDGQSLRHPSHFNSLYHNLTGCANFLSELYRHVEFLPEDAGEQQEHEGGGGGRSGKDKPDKKVEAAREGSRKEKQRLESPPAGGGDIHQKLQESRPADHHHHEPEVSVPGKNVKRISAEGNQNHKHSQEKETVVDKLAHDTAAIASQVFSKTKDAAVDFYKMIKSWVGRRKREAGARADDKFYSRFSLKSLAQTLSSDAKENFETTAFLATKARKEAQLHVAEMLKNFVRIVVGGCPADFEIDEDYLTRLCKLMDVQISEDLAQVEQGGSYLKINEKLEEEVKACANKIQVEDWLEESDETSKE